MAKEDKAPTEEEVRKAQDVIARAQQAKAAAELERRKPLVDILQSKGFQELAVSIRDLPAEILVDPNLSAHVQAIRVGIEGLQRMIPVDQISAT